MTFIYFCKNIVFLRKIVRGGADKSYGIQVARLAGLPDLVIDRAMELVSQLSDDKYELTVKNFQAALTTRDSWLTNFVPKAILAYHIKRLQADQTNLTRELATAGPDRQREIFTTLERINELKKKINIKLGRLK